MVTNYITNPADPLALSHDDEELVVSYGGESTTVGTLEVSAKKITGFYVHREPQLTYFAGQSLDLSRLSLVAEYNNGRYDVITSGYTTDISGRLDADHHGEYITVTFGGKTAAVGPLNIITDKQVVGVAVHRNPKLTYISGEELDLSGLSLEITYDSGETEIVTSGYSADLSGRLESSHNNGYVTVTYGGVSVRVGPLTVYPRQGPGGGDSGGSEGDTTESAEGSVLANAASGIGGNVAIDPADLPENGVLLVINDGTGSTVAVAAVDGQITLPDPPDREGYTFNGWYLDPECTIPYSGIYDNPIPLYAGWMVLGAAAPPNTGSVPLIVFAWAVVCLLPVSYSLIRRLLLPMELPERRR